MKFIFQAMRLFVGDPIWTPFNRPHDHLPARYAFSFSLSPSYLHPGFFCFYFSFAFIVLTLTDGSLFCRKEYLETFVQKESANHAVDAAAWNPSPVFVLYKRVLCGSRKNNAHQWLYSCHIVWLARVYWRLSMYQCETWKYECCSTCYLLYMCLSMNGVETDGCWCLWRARCILFSIRPLSEAEPTYYSSWWRMTMGRPTGPWATVESRLWSLFFSFFFLFFFPF